MYKRRNRKKYLRICIIIIGILIYINIKSTLNIRSGKKNHSNENIERKNNSNSNSFLLNNDTSKEYLKDDPDLYLDSNNFDEYDEKENEDNKKNDVSDDSPEENEEIVLAEIENDINLDNFGIGEIDEENINEEIDIEENINEEINNEENDKEENDNEENDNGENDNGENDNEENDNEENDNEENNNVENNNEENDNENLNDFSVGKSFIEIKNDSLNDIDNNDFDNDSLKEIDNNDSFSNVEIDFSILENIGGKNQLLENDDIDNYLLDNIDVVNELLRKVKGGDNILDDNDDELSGNIPYIDENIIIGDDKTYINLENTEEILLDNDNLKNLGSNIISDDMLNDDDIIDVDTITIKNYRGGELEPEWEWAKSISVVYTWVDGNDIDFLDEKSKYNGGYRIFNSRDRSADELRYSIRSLEKYMPWHNGTIYIVTNNQIPKWLDTSNPRIQMVYHHEYIPEYYLPTYDSNVIELFMDKIPGITEHYLYFNDDIFLNNYIHPSFFFTSKTFYPKVYRSYIVQLEKDKVDEVIKKKRVREMFYASKYYTRDIIRQYFDPDFEYRYLLHTVYVIYRDMMEPFRQLFKNDVIKLTCSDKFRSPFEPHTLYLYQTFLYYSTQHKDFPLKFGGKGKVNDYIGYPLPEKKDRTVKKYSVEMVPSKISKKFIKFGSVTNNYSRNQIKFDIFKNDKDLLVYNFNDEYSSESSFYQFTNYMITRFPEPSPFEKKEYKDLELAFQPLLKRIDALKEAVNEEFTDNNKENSNIKESVKQYQLDVVSQYINRRESLADPPRNVSEKEEEEINFLIDYDPFEEILEPEWEWARGISFVYYLERKKKDKNADSTVTEEDKLKYSIRSIEKYLPWFRGTIYIITQVKPTKANKMLSWLDIFDSHIKVVHQRTILPKVCKNTRNRHIVEMFLDRLPKISEKFIYMKPNQYFISFTHPRFFFNVDQYPKFYFKPPIPKDRLKTMFKKDKAFYRTHKIIKDYFGNSFFRSYRYLYNAPIALYRDIFPVVQQQFKTNIRKTLNNTYPEESDVLPMYLITNYIMYGAAQPFYPGFVAGYGKVRKEKEPFLNPKRTQYFYGYDIPSGTTIFNTAFFEVPFTSNYNDNRVKIKELNEKLTFEIAISFQFYTPSKYKPKIKKQFIDYMKIFFPRKSSYEL